MRKLSGYCHSKAILFRWGSIEYAVESRMPNSYASGTTWLLVSDICDFVSHFTEGFDNQTDLRPKIYIQSTCNGFITYSLHSQQHRHFMCCSVLFCCYSLPLWLSFLSAAFVARDVMNLMKQIGCCQHVKCVCSAMCVCVCVNIYFSKSRKQQPVERQTIRLNECFSLSKQNAFIFACVSHVCG